MTKRTTGMLGPSLMKVETCGVSSLRGESAGSSSAEEEGEEGGSSAAAGDGSNGGGDVEICANSSRFCRVGCEMKREMGERKKKKKKPRVFSSPVQLDLAVDSLDSASGAT